MGKEYGTEKILSGVGQITWYCNFDGIALPFDYCISSEPDLTGILGKTAYIFMDGGDATVLFGVRSLLFL